MMANTLRHFGQTCEGIIKMLNKLEFSQSKSIDIVPYSEFGLQLGSYKTHKNT